MLILAGSPPADSSEPALARSLAADMMGVSGAYVQIAMQLQREHPELLEQVRAGRVTLMAALRQAQGLAADRLNAEARTLRRRVTAILSEPGKYPEFAARLGELLKDFPAK